MTTGMMDVEHLYLSMEIGGTNLRYGVLDGTFRVLDFKKEPSRRLSDAVDKGEYIEGLVRPYIERYGKENFLCMALSLASLMNRERTVNYNSPNIKGFNNISLVDILTERTGLPVYMERDVNTALLYEIWKAIPCALTEKSISGTQARPVNWDTYRSWDLRTAAAAARMAVLS